jgi:CheY-like chemotaxis protein
VDVCLVEDDVSIVGIVQVLLEKAGLDLLSVDSCEGAILALRETRPRLLLVDLGLPDRSGLEIARVVRQRGKSRGRVAGGLLRVHCQAVCAADLPNHGEELGFGADTLTALAELPALPR